VAPIYRFMTGANMYRCEASSLEEALQIAFESLNPSPDARAVIENTMYEEGTQAVIHVPPEEVTRTDLIKPDKSNEEEED
jgi:hypothetical protein